MKKKILLLLLFIPYFLLSLAQESGIQFSKELSWNEIKVKAKQENKFIFVDCYATWCQPCKVMDTQVYPDDTLGLFVNPRYVSVKIQMDTTTHDPEPIRSWYAVANEFHKEYKISALPTYLFFSPEGKIVHKEMGSKNTSQFMELMANALNQNYQIYTLIELWRNHKVSYQEMPGLIKYLKSYREIDIASEVAKEYMLGYLDKLPENKFLQKQNIQFLSSNLSIIGPQSRAFTYYYHHSHQIDSIMGEIGYAQNMTKRIIYRQEVLPYLQDGINKEDIDWASIKKTLKSKYSKRIILLTIADAKIGWYSKQKLWNQYAKSIVEKINLEGYKNAPKSGFGPGVYLNTNAWEVFTYSHNKKELQTALKWVDYAIKLYPEIILPGSSQPLSVANPLDTKANLMYKLGRVKEAIAIQEEVVKIKPSMAKTLDKMKQGLPTWHIEKTN